MKQTNDRIHQHLKGLASNDKFRLLVLSLIPRIGHLLDLDSNARNPFIEVLLKSEALYNLNPSRFRKFLKNRVYRQYIAGLNIRQEISDNLTSNTSEDTKTLFLRLIEQSYASNLYPDEDPFRNCYNVSKMEAKRKMISYWIEYLFNQDTQMDYLHRIYILIQVLKCGSFDEACLEYDNRRNVRTLSSFPDFNEEAFGICYKLINCDVSSLKDAIKIYFPSISEEKINELQTHITTKQFNKYYPFVCNYLRLEKIKDSTISYQQFPKLTSQLSVEEKISQINAVKAFLTNSATNWCLLDSLLCVFHCNRSDIYLIYITDKQNIKTPIAVYTFNNVQGWQLFGTSHRQSIHISQAAKLIPIVEEIERFRSILNAHNSALPNLKKMVEFIGFVKNFYTSNILDFVQLYDFLYENMITNKVSYFEGSIQQEVLDDLLQIENSLGQQIIVIYHQAKLDTETIDNLGMFDDRVASAAKQLMLAHKKKKHVLSVENIDKIKSYSLLMTRFTQTRKQNIELLKLALKTFEFSRKESILVENLMP